MADKPDLRFFGNGLRFPDGRELSYERLMEMGAKRWAALTRLHQVMSVGTVMLDMLTSSELSDDELTEMCARLDRLRTAVSSIRPESQALFMFTLAIENAATGIDPSGNAVTGERVPMLAVIFLVAHGYADIADQIDRNDLNRLIRIWRGEEQFKGGKWAALISYGKRVLPDATAKKPSSLSRDYRDWKRNLPSDPNLRFAFAGRKP